MNDFDNAIVLITGAASGIGAATARRIAAGGARKLILADRDEQPLRDVADSLNVEKQLVVGDVADEALWTNTDLSGLTHALVNAGIGAGGAIDTLSFAEWRRVLTVNLDGAFLTLQAAMRAIKAGGRGGAIVITASIAGFKAEPGIAAYAASKAGVIQLARVAAKEGAPDRIRVNAIAPGGVETAIWKGIEGFNQMVAAQGEEAAFKAMAAMATPMARFAKPDEIAEQIAFLLSEKTAFTTGSVLVSDGGYSL